MEFIPLRTSSPAEPHEGHMWVQARTHTLVPVHMYMHTHPSAEEKLSAEHIYNSYQWQTGFTLFEQHCDSETGAL